MSEALSNPTARIAGTSSRWVVVALLTGVTAALATQVLMPAPQAAADVSVGQSGQRIFAVAGEVTQGVYGLYLVDQENGTIGMYQWVPATRKFRLMAARNYRFDLQLDEYNTEPSPREIQNLVIQHRRLESATSRAVEP